MASMVAKVNNSNCSSHMSSMSIRPKGTRNKRKFRTDHKGSDPNKVLTLPVKDGLIHECSGMEVEVTATYEQVHVPCDMCGTCQNSSADLKRVLELSSAGIEGLSSEVVRGLSSEVVRGDELDDADWSEPTEIQLEELVLSNLDAIFRSAIKRIVASGYTEEAATKAVLKSGLCLGPKDPVSNIVDNAMVVLRNGQNADPFGEQCFFDLQQLEKYVLAELVCLLRGVKPFFSKGDAMWCLLISDMKVSHASAMEYDAYGSRTGDGGSQNPSVIMSNPTQLPFKPESKSTKMSVTIPCKPISAVPCALVNQSGVADPSKLTVPKKSSKGGSTSSSHSPLEKPLSAGMSQACAVDEKSVSARNLPSTISKKEYALQQKSLHVEKTYKVNVTNDICKTSSVYSYIMDQRGKAMADSGSVKVKNTPRKSRKEKVNVTCENGSLSISTNSAHSSASTTVTKENRRTIPQSATTVHALPAPISRAKPTVAEIDAKLCPPSSMKSDTRQVNVSVNSEAPNTVYARASYDKSRAQWVPVNKKDDMIFKLIPRVQVLQTQLQEWTEWANRRVMQAAQRLGKDKAELKILRQEKEEVERLQNDKHSLQENTVKKLSEMENALVKASGQIEQANAAVRRLKVENSTLRQEMEAAKLRAAESAASCQEVSKREKKTLMDIQSWEREKSIFQEELASDRRKFSHLQQELVQARDRHTQIVALWKQEEKAKDELLARASSIRKEREQLELSAESKEHATILKAEANLQKYKDDISKLENEISQLRMKTESSKIAALKGGIDGSYANRLSNSQNSPISKELWDSYQPGNRLQDFLGVGGVMRDRECVMCLSEEMSVVFLPCAHQVVCKKCNELHEKQGMNDCPSCRCPIMRRICVRYAS
ncbi:hypothetical protein vseg_014349 [Gypsophila vaccaria]